MNATGTVIRSLGLGFPSVVRTNAYWRRTRPDLVARAEEMSLARLWGRAPSGTTPTAFDEAMAPYAGDPFRGAVERRIRARGESALSMEVTAARGALSAAGLEPGDVDLVLVSSFMGDRLGVGNAAYFAAALELDVPAWNFETACASSVVGLELASTLVRAGAYRRILVVASTSNSLQVEPSDTLAWFVGDGAGAMVVERGDDALGILGHHTVNSIGTNDMFVIRSREGGRFTTEPSDHAASMARDTAEPYLRECVDRAVADAGMTIGDVDYWIFNTPNAWYADFCGRALGVTPDRYGSVYARYGNVGSALMPATLYHAVHEGRVKPGQVIGLYAIGSSSTASAAILRVGSIALGPYPTRPAVDDADAEVDGPTSVLATHERRSE